MGREGTNKCRRLLQAVESLKGRGARRAERERRVVQRRAARGHVEEDVVQSQPRFQGRRSGEEEGQRKRTPQQLPPSLRCSDPPSSPPSPPHQCLPGEERRAEAGAGAGPPLSSPPPTLRLPVLVSLSLQD